MAGIAQGGGPVQGAECLPQLVLGPLARQRRRLGVRQDEEQLVAAGQDLVQAPAIMVSTEAEDNDRRQAFEAGANLYIVKPTRGEVLLRYVKLLLGEAA